MSVSDDGTTFTFALEAKKPFLYFKPCWRIGGDTRWAVGSNGLVLMTAQGARDVYPYFFGAVSGSFSPLIELDSPILGRRHLVRAYVPPGYHENSLKKYPVLFMQDGKNLFFPDEAFAGHDWSVDDSLQLLDGMNDRQDVVIGIHQATGWPVRSRATRHARSVVEKSFPGEPAPRAS